MALAPTATGSPLTAFTALGLLLACLLLAPVLEAREVQASLDRDTVYQGDTLVLTITLVGARTAQPDLSPLRRDFEILGNRSSTQVQIVNGASSMQRQWQVELAPRRSGTLRIPALRVGDGQTAPLTVTVTETPPEPVDNDAISLAVSVETGDGEPYVQSQILYTVQLRFAIPLLEGSLGDPEPARAVVERLGDDRSYHTTIDGKRYGVVERHYAIFPETSGELEIPPLRFRGRVATRDNPGLGRSSAFDNFFDRGQPVNARSRALTLEVQPQPAGFQGDWLPARDLHLQEMWHEDLERARVGEPLTRSILLEADGLSAAHLPALSLPEIPGARVYPEPASTENRHNGQWIRARQVRNFAVLPTRAGTLEIPELEIPWWDVTRGERRVARLPARTIQVASAPAAPGDAMPVPERAPATVVDDDATGIDRPVSPPVEIPPYWLYALGATALLALLLAGVRRFWQRSSLPARLALWWQLRRHCGQRQARPAAHALLAWAARRWPVEPPRNLGELAARVHAAQAQQVRELARALYAAEVGQWRGDKLWQALRRGLREPPRERRVPYRLPPLYSQQG